MNKRVLVAIAVILVAIIGVAVVVYIIKNDKDAVDNPGAYYGKDANGFSASVNPDEHIGTAKVLTKDQVQAGFGQGATIEGNVRESGTVNLGTTKSETATYTVKTSKGEVTFEVDVRTYASTEDFKRANPFAGAEEAKIEGLANEAHYFVPYGQERLNEQQVALLTVKGKTSYKFAIVQPTSKIIYSVEDSKPILLELAKQAKLDEIK